MANVLTRRPKAEALAEAIHHREPQERRSLQVRYAPSHLKRRCHLDEALVTLFLPLTVQDVSRRLRVGLGETAGDELSAESTFLAAEARRVRTVNIEPVPHALCNSWGALCRCSVECEGDMLRLSFEHEAGIFDG